MRSQAEDGKVASSGGTVSFKPLAESFGAEIVGIDPERLTPPL